jgi:hypothetical protein
MAPRKSERTARQPDTKKGMTQDIYLTGITTTGTPHSGNYVGGIRPGIAASRDP